MDSLVRLAIAHSGLEKVLGGGAQEGSARLSAVVNRCLGWRSAYGFSLGEVWMITEVRLLYSLLLCEKTYE